MTSLARVAELAAPENWLAVLVTIRPSGTPSVSVVNAGIVADPVTGDTAKLANLRRNPHATLVFRSTWEWVAVHGTARIAGPDDPLPGLAPAAVPQLLRDIYHAAGGTHPDLDEYDRQMVADRRAAVLLTPQRFSTNPGNG
jgi:PPOX class probable F420-dependent enzyme